jgi:hypothetical protein
MRNVTTEMISLLDIGRRDVVTLKPADIWIRVLLVETEGSVPPTESVKIKPLVKPLL